MALPLGLWLARLLGMALTLGLLLAPLLGLLLTPMLGLMGTLVLTGWLDRGWIWHWGWHGVDGGDLADAGTRAGAVTDWRCQGLVLSRAGAVTGWPVSIRMG